MKSTRKTQNATAAAAAAAAAAATATVAAAPAPGIAGRFEDADAFYEQLLDAHTGLSREESEALNARLVLLLANEVGDAARLAACVTAAREAG